MSNNTVNLFFSEGSGGSGGTGVSFAQLTETSGVLQTQIDAFGSTGVSVTFAQLTGASGHLQAEIDLSATFAQLTGASGILRSYTNIVSGDISGWVTGYVAVHGGTGGGGGGGGVASGYSSMIYQPDNSPASASPWNVEWKDAVTGQGVGVFDFTGSGINLPGVSIIGNSLVSRGGIVGDTNAAVFVKGIPSGSDWSVTAKVTWNGTYLQTDEIGLVVFSPSLLNYRYIIIQQAGVINHVIQGFQDVNNGGFGVQGEPATSPIAYLRIEKLGTQFTYLKSIDGLAFEPFLVDPDYTSFMTDGIESIGIFTNGSYSSCAWIRKDWEPEDSVDNPQLFPL